MGKASLHKIDRLAIYVAKDSTYTQLQLCAYISPLNCAVRLFGKKKWIFQHDNDPKHVSEVTQEYLDDLEISRLSWPAQSPDLIPLGLENLWSNLDQRCSSRTCKNEVEFFEILQKAWDEIVAETMFHLVESMPRRIQAVLIAKGFPTHY